MVAALRSSEESRRPWISLGSPKRPLVFHPPTDNSRKCCGEKPVRYSPIAARLSWRDGHRVADEGFLEIELAFDAPPCLVGNAILLV